jgi:hypothetical protein
MRISLPRRGEHEFLGLYREARLVDQLIFARRVDRDGLSRAGVV